MRLLTVWLAYLDVVLGLISSYAALGDSYAAGHGAGDPILLPGGLPWCGWHSGAYPFYVESDGRLGIEHTRYLACGGAVSTVVLKTQIPFVGQSDLVTIQVGGNELDFFKLLNECIQQWGPVSSCEKELAIVRGLIQSTNFIDRFDALVIGATKKVKPEAKLLVLGYARFFNEKTAQCDRVSFSRRYPSNLLTKSKRTQFNDLIDMLNDVIRGIAEAHGAIYLDTNALFEGHRFCEEGVAEPAESASWFFNDMPVSSSKTVFEQQGISDTSWDFVKFSRTFHPTEEGHRAIADKIVDTVISVSG